MKTALRTYIPILLLSLLASAGVFAQAITWTAPVSIAPRTYENDHPRIALNGSGNPVVIWGSSASSSFYLSRWTGSSFSGPTKMNPTGVDVFTASWAGPDLAAKGDTVYIVYKAEPEDTAGVYVLRSTDGGASFPIRTRVSDITGYSTRFPSITTNDIGQPVLAVMKFSSIPGSDRWVALKSTDWGASFSAEVVASGYNNEPVCDCCPSGIISSGSNSVALYRNDWNDQRTIWMAHSTNAGNTFPMGMDIDKTNWMINSCPSSGPDGVIIGDTVYATFMSGSGGTKAYYSKTSLSGMSTSGAIALTGAGTGISGQNYPRIAADGKTVAMVWPQTENGIPQIGIRFAANVQNGLPAWDKAIVNPAGNSIMNVDVAVKDGYIHLVWEDMATNTVQYSKGSYNAAAISSISNSNGLSLSPIPVNDQLVLSLEHPISEPGSISITDVAGHVVLQEDYPAFEKEVRISTGKLPSGVYQLRLRAAGGFLSHKFIVSH